MLDRLLSVLVLLLFLSSSFQAEETGRTEGSIQENLEEWSGAKQGEVVDCEGSVGRPIPGSESGSSFEEIQLGDAVRDEDRLLTRETGALEIVFGINSRLRLGPQTTLAFLSLTTQTSSPTSLSVTRRLRLEEGSLRLRVRLNTVMPITFEIESGNALLTLRQGDLLLQRDSQKTEVAILKGEVEIRTKKPQDSSWPSHMAPRTFSSEQVLVIPETGKETEPPLWVQSLDRDAVEGRRRRLLFTVERSQEELPPAPVEERIHAGP